MLVEMVDPPIGERLDILLHRVIQSLHQRTIPYLAWGKSFLDKYKSPEERQMEIDAAIALHTKTPQRVVVKGEKFGS